METWWAGSTTTAMVIHDIDEGAELTMREDATRALSVIRCRQLPKDAVTSRKLAVLEHQHLHPADQTRTAGKSA